MEDGRAAWLDQLRRIREDLLARRDALDRRARPFGWKVEVEDPERISAATGWRVVKEGRSSPEVQGALETVERWIEAREASSRK